MVKILKYLYPAVWMQSVVITTSMCVIVILIQYRLDHLLNLVSASAQISRRLIPLQLILY